jgi:hypothetical protein
MPPAVRARHVRALTLASASFGLGLAGHLEAGGHSGSTRSLLFGAAFCALSGWLWSWRRLPARAVAGVLLANQAVMHVAMVLGTSPMPAAPTDPMQADCGMAPDSPAMSLIPGGWMILAHLVATVLAAATIVATEALWLGLTALARWIERVFRVVLLAPFLPLRLRGTLSIAVPHWATRVVGACPGRGPPHLHLSW